MREICVRYVNKIPIGQENVSRCLCMVCIVHFAFTTKCQKPLFLVSMFDFGHIFPCIAHDDVDDNLI